MKDLNENQLKKLYSDFVYYSDKECDGFAKMSVQEYYQKHKSKYENLVLNQCDGCSRGLILFDGLHRLENGYPVMTCQAGLYE